MDLSILRKDSYASSSSDSLQRPDRLRIKSVTAHINEFGLKSVFDAVDLTDETCEEDSPIIGTYSHGQIQWNIPFAAGPDIYKFDPPRKQSYVQEMRRKMSAVSRRPPTATGIRKPSTAQDWSRKMSAFPKPLLPPVPRAPSVPEDLDEVDPATPRRPSQGLISLVEALDPLKVKGNPLGMEINETRRLPSISFASSTNFNGRRPSAYPKLSPNRRPSSHYSSGGYSRRPSRYSTGPRSRRPSAYPVLTKDGSPSMIPQPLAIRKPSINPTRRPSVNSHFSKPFPQIRTPSFSYQRPDSEEMEADYVIQRFAAADDAEKLSTFERICHRMSPIFALCSFGTYCVYFALRVLFTRDTETKSNKIYWMAWTFMIVEILLTMPIILQRLWKWAAVGAVKRPKLRLTGGSVPSVDVIITCCGEDDQMVLDTAKAACNIDYPGTRFRVLVCDDGKSRNLAQGVIDLVDDGFDNLYYRSRPRYGGVPHDFKAGNLNYAMEETNHLPGGAASFFAVLDANMIPTRDWLRALLPHMLQNTKCSMACPPQMFYNIPVDDPLCQRSESFVHISDPIKDALGVAWCTGSGYVLRREALEGIGGFPTGSMADEACCSSMLLGSGWSTAFINEPLQWGTVTNRLSTYLKQQRRKTIGAIQTSLKLRFGLFGPYVKHMSITQRMCAFFYTFSPLLIVLLLLAMLAAPSALISRGEMIPYTTTNQLRWLIRSFFISLVFHQLDDFVCYISSGTPPSHKQVRAMMWMAPFHTISIIHAFFVPRWLKRKPSARTSTDLSRSYVNERDARKHAPLIQRLKITLWDCKVYLHLIYFLLVLTVVGLSVYWCVTDPKNNTINAKLEAVLTHAGWPPLVWLACASSCWIPLKYALFPPKMSDREELMIRSQKTRIAYPTPDARKEKTSWWSWLDELQYSALTAYTGSLFLLTFML